MTTTPIFQVCQTRKTSSTVSDASSKFATMTKIKSSLEFLVKAEDAFGDYIGAGNVSDTQVLDAAGLPKVNGTTFFDSNSGQARPFMMCTGKSCRRDPKNGSVFWVTADYEEITDGGENPGSDCPVLLTDITPKSIGAVTLVPRVLYEDMSPAAKDCYRIPVVNEPFETPVTTDDPRFVLQIEQYESSITYDAMMYRIGLVNSGRYRTKPAGYWKIVDLTVKEVEVSLCNGTVTAAHCTYSIELSNYSVGNYITGGGPDGELYKQFFVGHDTALPLVSRFYNDGAGKTAFADNATGYGDVGFILETGEPNPNDERPNYVIYQSTRRGSYSFLQV